MAVSFVTCDTCFGSMTFAIVLGIGFCKAQAHGHIATADKCQNLGRRGARL